MSTKPTDAGEKRWRISEKTYEGFYHILCGERIIVRWASNSRPGLDLIISAHNDSIPPSPGVPQTQEGEEASPEVIEAADVAEEQIRKFLSSRHIFNTPPGPDEIEGVKSIVLRFIVRAQSAALSASGEKEKERIQAIADHEGLLQCRKLLQVKDGDNLYDAIKRLLASAHATTQSTLANESHEETGLAFVIYRPVMGYEESETSYFVCHTRAQADEAVKIMREHMDALLLKLPTYPTDEEDDPDAIKWERVDNKRRKILSKVEWPFDIDLHDEIRSEFGENSWDNNAVSVMELPLLAQSAQQIPSLPSQPQVEGKPKESSSSSKSVETGVEGI